jgi:hypothetical protein
MLSFVLDTSGGRLYWAGPSPTLGESIIIAAYHGHIRSLPELYKYRLDKTMDKHDKRLNCFLNNSYSLIDKFALEVWPNSNSKYYVFPSDVIQRFGEYNRSIQKDLIMLDTKNNNTQENLVTNYIYNGCPDKFKVKPTFPVKTIFSLLSISCFQHSGHRNL